MAVIQIKVDGTKTILDMKQPPTLEEAHALVGGWVQLVYGKMRLENKDGEVVPTDAQFILDEEGKLKGYQINVVATLFALQAQAISPDDVLVGDVIILTHEHKWN